MGKPNATIKKLSVYKARDDNEGRVQARGQKGRESTENWKQNSDPRSIYSVTSRITSMLSF